MFYNMEFPITGSPSRWESHDLRDQYVICFASLPSALFCCSPHASQVVCRARLKVNTMNPLMHQSTARPSQFTLASMNLSKR